MQPLVNDPLLRDVPTHFGFKVLAPCVLVEKLGEGAMGSVFRGRHLNLDIDVAVKCLLPEFAATNQEYIARFEREAKIAAQISQENLVRVYDTLDAHNLRYTVMEYVDGENVEGRVARKGPLTVREALSILLPCARATGALHERRIIHRDIKPPNIMVSQTGVVKLADLGIAKDEQHLDQLRTAAQSMMGTPQYMAPEQFEDSAAVTDRADVYALGVTLAFMLTGRHIMQGSSVHEVLKKVVVAGFPDPLEICPDLPPSVCDLMRKCVQKEAAKRPSAAELVDQCTRVIYELGGPVLLADANASRSYGTGTLPSRLDRDVMLQIRAMVTQMRRPPTMMQMATVMDDLPQTMMQKPGTPGTVGLGATPPAYPPTYVGGAPQHGGPPPQPTQYGQAPYGQPQYGQPHYGQPYGQQYAPPPKSGGMMKWLLVAMLLLTVALVGAVAGIPQLRQQVMRLVQGTDVVKPVVDPNKPKNDQPKPPADNTNKGSNNQTPKSDQPPKVEPPKTEPPKTEPPKVEPPKVEPPKVEPPRNDQPKVDPTRNQPPRTDPPKTEPPKTDQPKTDQPPKTVNPPVNPLDPHGNPISRNDQPPRSDQPNVQPPRVEPPRNEPPRTEPPRTEPPKAQPPAFDMAAAQSEVQRLARMGDWRRMLEQLSAAAEHVKASPNPAGFTQLANDVLEQFRTRNPLERRDRIQRLYDLLVPVATDAQSSVAKLLIAEQIIQYDENGYNLVDVEKTDATTRERLRIAVEFGEQAIVDRVAPQLDAIPLIADVLFAYGPLRNNDKGMEWLSLGDRRGHVESSARLGYWTLQYSAALVRAGKNRADDPKIRKMQIDAERLLSQSAERGSRFGAYQYALMCELKLNSHQGTTEQRAKWLKDRDTYYRQAARDGMPRAIAKCRELGIR